MRRTHNTCEYFIKSSLANFEATLSLSSLDEIKLINKFKTKPRYGMTNNI